jgi:hypothetical protein
LADPVGRAAILTALRRGTPVTAVFRAPGGSETTIAVDARDFERAYQVLLSKR